MTDSWNNCRRWLAIRLDALGDVLMTTPALRAIRDSGPDRHVTLLTSPAGAEVATQVPEIDETIVYESPWMKATPPRGDSAVDQQMIERLNREKFDGAVIFTVYSQNPLPAAMLAYLAEIPRRAAHCRENPYQLLTTWVHETEPDQQIRHEVERQLDLVAELGCRTSNRRLSLGVRPNDDAAVRELLRGLRLPAGRRWLLVHPGGSAASRRYPPEHFAAVIDLLMVRHGIDVLLIGSAGERELVESIARSTRVRPRTLTGLDFGRLAALIRRAPLMIANNSGPAHVAAAVGTPVVSLYALTNPQHTPWHVPHRLLTNPTPCAYCYKSVCPEEHHDCLRGIMPRAVVAATISLLEENSPPLASQPGGPLAELAELSR